MTAQQAKLFRKIRNMSKNCYGESDFYKSIRWVDMRYALATPEIIKKRGWSFVTDIQDGTYVVEDWSIAAGSTQ